MTPEERYKAQEKIMERALDEIQALEEDPGVIVGWVVLTAVREGEELDRVAHAYLMPQGQPHFASVGLVLTNLDVLRGIGDTQWKDQP